MNRPPNPDDLTALEQATSRLRKNAIDLGSQVDPLREGWRNLGQLLEAARPAPLAVERLTRRVQQRLHVRRAATAQRWRRWSVGAAVAACLLLAITLVTVGQWPQLGISNERAVAPSAQLARLTVRGVMPAAAWDDPLEPAFAAAEQDLHELERQWQSRSNPFDQVRLRLAALEADLRDSPL